MRKEGAIDWRELYEILSYMVKQPFYCGEDQKKYYQETKQKADRDKMNPVYKRFFDIEDSVRANRLETRERAIANGWNTKIDENGRIVSDNVEPASVDVSDDLHRDDSQRESTEESQLQDETELAVADNQKKHNFHYNLWELEKGGAKTRYQWNMDAIRTLKQIESENRLATPEEQKVLSKFVGWGGLSQAFDENNESWSKEYKELKEMLSDEEYAAARATVNNAFYTSPEIAMCMNSALVQFGFRSGNVLEPSMGIGNFFGSMPAPMQRSKLYGVELDSISGRIAKQLYQNANISITGFENTTYPDNFFDVVVGNVPFGDYKVFDPKYNKYNFRIHDYFLAKALDQVRPGGMVAVITTKGTLDKANPTIRKYMAERAELVGAIRLPNTAFKDNAGTEVTADILFLQKRERKIDIEPDWVHLGVTGNGIAVNSYFAEHPEMMLGVMEYDTRIYGQDSRYTVCVNDDENFNMYEALNKAIGNIKAQMTDFERVADEAEQTKEVIPADPDVRNYTYTFFEGKLYYRENSEMVRKEVSQTAEERIRSLDEIRQITRELIDIQMDGCSEEELSDKQRLLNVKYDAFVKQYGAITSKANRIAFRDDSDYPLLCSLEEVNEDGEVKKADMFYKQTIKAKTVIDRVETAVEALNVSVNELLKKNAMKERANDVFEICSYVDGLEKKIDSMKEELTNMQNQIKEMQEDTLVNNAKKALSEAQERLNARCEQIKSQVLEVKAQVKSTAKSIVDEAKAKGRAALYRVSEFLEIKKRLLDMRENIRGAIKITDKDIAKTALLAKGFREAGQTAANAFRTFADKPEMDYSQKEQKHPITKTVLAPMKAVKKMLVSMKLHLDASIDKLDNLAMNVQLDKEKHMEKEQKQTEPERVEAERVETEIVYSPMVAEPQEYQYNADAFEARDVDEVKQEAAHKEVSQVREDKAR